MLFWKSLVVCLLLLDNLVVTSLLTPTCFHGTSHRPSYRQSTRSTLLHSFKRKKKSEHGQEQKQYPSAKPKPILASETTASINSTTTKNSSALQHLTDKILNNQHVDESDVFLVLTSWCNTCTNQGAAMVETLLRKLPAQLLTRRQCTLGVEAWSKAGVVEKARASLAWMQTMSVQHAHLKPTRIAYKYLLEAHLRTGQLEEASVLLRDMEESGDPMLQPLTHDYNLLLFAYARNGAAAESETLLKHMVDQCKQLDAAAPQCDCPCAPDVYSYYFLLDAHARSNNPRAGHRAMEILHQLESLADVEVRVDARMYTAVIHAIARNIPNIEEVVKQVETLFEQAKIRGIEPDKYLYNAVLDVHANNDAPGSAERAEEILREITAAEGVASDVAYNTVLKAWKSSRHVEACERSLAILQYMEEQRLASTVSYTTVIGTLANLGTKAAAMFANDILENMQREFLNGNMEVQPDQQTYNSLLNAWVRCGETQRAELLLRTMERNDNNDTAICAPSVISYSTVMSGWSKSNEPYAWKRAENILSRMIAKYKATGDECLAPNAFSYVSLINAYANSRDSRAAAEADDTLKWMYKEYKAGRTDLKPHTKIVTRVIDAYKNSGREDAGRQAEALLDWLLEKYESTQDVDFAPTGYTFSAVVAAWSKSRQFEKAIRVRRVLARMVELHEAGTITAKPNTALFTAVIYTCGFCANDSIERASSLRVAIETYNELRQPTFPYGSPNNVTYLSMLTVLKNLLPSGKERTSAALAVFNTAKESGFVDYKVIRRLFSIVSPKELDGLIPPELLHGRASLKHIPLDWSRKIQFSK
ncbi:hypothetical protein MPSEU_000190700 [Mayamaea pseudoterrestris]|nr:hypothetical protein MPSEU_000190700 [Mayamaea pseudoterrestris]